MHSGFSGAYLCCSLCCLVEYHCSNLILTLQVIALVFWLCHGLINTWCEQFSWDWRITLQLTYLCQQCSSIDCQTHTPNFLLQGHWVFLHCQSWWWCHLPQHFSAFIWCPKWWFLFYCHLTLIGLWTSNSIFQRYKFLNYVYSFACQLGRWVWNLGKVGCHQCGNEKWIPWALHKSPRGEVYNVKRIGPIQIPVELPIWVVWGWILNFSQHFQG